MEEQVPHVFSEQEEGERAQQPQNDAQLHGALDRLADTARIADGCSLGDGGQQQNGEGACNDGGQHEDRHCHTGESPEYAECILASAAEGDERGGNEDGLGAGEQVQDDTAPGQGCGKADEAVHHGKGELCAPKTEGRQAKEAGGCLTENNAPHRKRRAHLPALLLCDEIEKINGKYPHTLLKEL